ncbi:MAG: hypothetical protein PWP24_1480 [Clostridiales bacterium]|nr:hypothetical protein [Clostridiales bacterium]
MNIAVLSGKGGTGKTTVSTNLARTMGVRYIDCDVEEPNGFLFLKPQIQKVEEVEAEYPVIDQNVCTLCGACAKNCQFHALAKAGDEIVVFQKLCHSCGACQFVCKFKALSYQTRSIGIVEQGMAGNIACLSGVLEVGEPMAVPVIRKLLKGALEHDHLIDCPPGTSCNVVASLQAADAAIFVTEPSKFGLHDLKMAVSLVQTFQVPYGVIINKDDGACNQIKAYCKEEGILLLGVIPYSKEAAILYSNGKMLCESKHYHEIFEELAVRVKEAFGW